VRVAVTGTPGTGKTTATDRLETDLEVIHVNELVDREGLAVGVDEERGSTIVDLEALADRLVDREDVLFESHLAHHLAADRVAVLRCHPGRLRERLRARGEPERTVEENAESEALDLLLAEAVERHGRGSVYEIDTTDLEPAAVARELAGVVDGSREPSAGEVDFLDAR